MHPWVMEGIGRERLKQLYLEAERERLAHPAGPAGRRKRVRVAVGDRLVRLGMRLAGPEHGRALRVRYEE